MSEQEISPKTNKGLWAFLERPAGVINVGLASFGEALRRQNVQVVQVDWHPPRTEFEPSPATRLANKEAWAQFDSARPRLVGVRRAGEVIVDWPENTVVSPGPPLPEGVPLPPQLREVAVSLLLAEGWASDAGEGDQLLADAQVTFIPSAAWNVALPAFTLLSPAMFVFVLEDEEGRQAFGPLWTQPAAGDLAQSSRSTLAQSLDAALVSTGGLDLVALVLQGLLAGDVGYGPGPVGQAILFLELVERLVQAEQEVASSHLDLLKGEAHLYLNLLLPMTRLLSGRAVRTGGSLVTRMGGNGLLFGLGIGSEWVALSAASPELAFVGDDPMLELMGLGMMSLAASPALALHLGMKPAEGIQMTLEMYEITQGASQRWPVPLLEPRGVPLGLNAWHVLESGLLPAVLSRWGTPWTMMSVPAELFREALR